MNQYKGFTIHLSGYSDAKGISAYNKKLAGQRASQVQKFFMNNGLSNVKITVEGYGSINFVAENSNPDGTDNPVGRALNRRVELKIDMKASSLIIIHQNNLSGDL